MHPEHILVTPIYSQRCLISASCIDNVILVIFTFFLLLVQLDIFVQTSLKINANNNFSHFKADYPSSFAFDV